MKMIDDSNPFIPGAERPGRMAPSDAVLLGQAGLLEALADSSGRSPVIISTDFFLIAVNGDRE